MSTKPWPLPAKSDGKCGQEIKPLPQPWPSTQAIVATQDQLPATVDCGQKTVAKAEIEIDGAEVVPLASAGKSATTVAQQAPWRWQKGVSGNPQGRKLGSKHKITELARSIVAEDFAEHGRATLARVRLTDPVSYMHIVLKFVPRELILKQEQGKLLDYSHLAKEENHEELNEFVKERDNHAKIESIVDGLDTEYKKGC